MRSAGNGGHGEERKQSLPFPVVHRATFFHRALSRSIMRTNKDIFGSTSGGELLKKKRTWIGQSCYNASLVFVISS